MDTGVDRRRVELGHVLVDEDFRRAGSADLAAELDRERREEHVVGIPGDSVGRLGVDLLPGRVQLPELAFAPRQRAIRPAHAFPCSVDADVEVHRESVRAQPLAVERREDGASAERDDGLGTGERLGERRLLESPELRLSSLEELRNRAVPLLDEPVEATARPP